MRPGHSRIAIAGLAGDAGKTLVAAGLARALARRGERVAPFKKGPDFIDAAWLGLAAGRPGRNLDTFLMSPAVISLSVERAAVDADLVLVEGNRGLFDGADARGTHSTAQLAHIIGAPVVLVVSAAKATRTVSALVLGCRALDPDLPLAGVVLNRLGTRRQEDVIRRALAADAGVPVLGAIPRLEPEEAPLPGRHLGLVCAAEHPDAERAVERLADLIERHVDIDALRRAASPPRQVAWPPPERPRPSGRRVRVGVLRDAAFSLYYPENLEALEAAGAQVVPLSPLADRTLPHLDALYAGGGFPEEHLPALSANRAFRAALLSALAAGLPAWAECGGLMYLARAIVRDGRAHPMVGALPAVVEHSSRPQGHGYVAATVDRENPFLPLGTRLLGHEFHHSRVVGAPGGGTVLAVERGTGLGGGRDGLAAGAVVATYLHVHALATPGWAPALVQAARRHAARAEALARQARAGAEFPGASRAPAAPLREVACAGGTP